MGHVGFKTRSPGQIIRKPCFHSRGHICDLILMKTGQNVVSAISRQSSNMGHVESKNRSPGQILEHSCFHSTRRHICDPILMKLDQNVCLGNI